MPAHRARAGGSCRPKATRLPDQVREVLRYQHYAYKAAQIRMHRSLRFIRFKGTRHPAEMGKPEIERFLSHLGINRTVSASTRSQAMNAILFLYRHVLDLPVADQLTLDKWCRSRYIRRSTQTFWPRHLFPEINTSPFLSTKRRYTFRRSVEGKR